MKQAFKWMVAGVSVVAAACVVCAENKTADTKAGADKPAVTEKAPVGFIKSIFHKQDANKDGKLTAEEQRARRKDWHKELDANKDGKLTEDEFCGQRFVDIDVNKDGVVTMEEYIVFFAGIDAAADKTAACEKMDADGDGEVTLVEVVAYRKSVFAAMDSNADGKVTPEEMKCHAGKEFKKLDADNDGFVTVEEMIAVIPVAVASKAEVTKAAQPAK